MNFLTTFFMQHHQKIGIIGAGIAGIAAAIRMAVLGFEVEVFETNAFAGGKLSEFTTNGYRFDFGPSLFTMPRYVDELFELAGEDPKAHFEYIRLPVVCHYFWEDGTRLHAHADAEAFSEEAHRVLGVEKNLVKHALQHASKKYALTGKTFLEKSLHRASTWLTSDTARAITQLGHLDIFSSMNAVHERELRHPKLVQLFNRFATYNGSSPYKASGILSMIPYFEHQVGAFLPKKGMYDISKSLYELALRKGVRFHFNTRVTEIVVENNIAKALKISNETLYFDKIISNCDVFFTYQHLLPRAKQPTYILRQEKSSSAVIFYWGVERHFPELNLHNILFSDDYRAEFEALGTGKLSDDPTIYINITSKYCPDDAPAHGENWFVMINAPFKADQNWDELVQHLRQNVIQKINRILKINIEKLISTETIIDPRTIEQKTMSHLGALYGTSSNSMLAAFLRHPNFSSDLKNLYFCGGSAHPGGGIPLCLLSAKIVSEVMH
jgi:phytoene desaturase